jgi:DNA-directed RNA polymerase specialized sigma24 family protein
MKTIESIVNRRHIKGYTREDIRQEAYLAYHQAISQGLPPAVAIEKADNHLRKIALRLPPLHPVADANPLPELQPDCVLTEVVAQEGFERLMEGLTERQKEILRMTYQHEGTDEEVAEALGFSTPRRLQIARNKILCHLRKVLQENVGTVD